MLSSISITKSSGGSSYCNVPHIEKYDSSDASSVVIVDLSCDTNDYLPNIFKVDVSTSNTGSLVGSVYEQVWSSGGGDSFIYMRYYDRDESKIYFVNAIKDRGLFYSIDLNTMTLADGTYKLHYHNK